jgi:hypothetical protein
MKPIKSVRQELSTGLMKVLKETGDGTTYDKSPFPGDWKRPFTKASDGWSNKVIECDAIVLQ